MIHYHTNTFLAIILLFAMSITACTPTKKLEDAEKATTNDAKIVNFEGAITYDIKFKDKTGLISDEEMTRMMGGKHLYRIKGNKYKSEIKDGLLKLTALFLGNDTLYTHIRGTENLLWTATTEQIDSIISHEITENADTILGKSCHLLTVESKLGTTKYYYHADYAMTDSLYKNHKYGLWHFCLAQTQAMPLKQISDLKEEYMEMVATAIDTTAVNDSIFALPQGLQLMENPDK